MNTKLSQQKPLPSKLADVVQRLGIADHTIDWRRMTEGRSNHALTEVFIIFLDIPPMAVVIKLAGQHESSKNAISSERKVLEIISKAAANNQLAAPLLYPATGLNHDELAITYLPGTTLEKYSGTNLDIKPLAKELAQTLNELWQHESGPDNKLENYQVINRLRGILTDELENELMNWFTRRHKWLTPIKPSLIHGDLKPANIIVFEAAEQLHLSGLIDFTKAKIGNPAFDIAMLELTLAPIHRQLYGEFENYLAPIDQANYCDAKIVLISEIIYGCASIRDWEGFNRNCTKLASLLKSAI